MPSAKLVDMVIYLLGASSSVSYGATSGKRRHELLFFVTSGHEENGVGDFVFFKGGDVFGLGDSVHF
jgi:hypothetical protein